MSGALPPRSERFVRFFIWYARRYVSSRFHSLRLSFHDRPEISATRGLVVFLNHPSWWDPLIGLLLAHYTMPERAVYAAMEANALEQYGFFKRLGAIGVDASDFKGVRAFIRTAERVMVDPKKALWITPEGQFCDPRVTDQPFARGLAVLAARAQGVDFLPLALEYPFWTEPRPEALARFGPLIPSEQLRSKEAAQETLTAALRAAQQGLANQSMRRDDQFQDVLLRRSGVHPVYDLWRRFKAFLTGQSYSSAHLEPDL